MKFIVMIFLAIAFTPNAGFADQQEDAKHKADYERFVKTYNSSLSTAKEDVSVEYKKIMDLLPKDAQEALQKSQESWLEYIKVADVALENDKEHDKSLSILYENRVNELEKDIYQVGPLSVETIRLYKAAKAQLDDSGDTNLPLAEWEASFPRIYAPKTPATEKLNAIYSGIKPPQLDNSQGSQLRDDATIVFASSQIISVSTGTWEYYSGTPHGNGLEGYDTYILQPEPHLLKSEDLFKKGSNWEKLLSAKCIAEGKRIDISSMDENITHTVELRVKDVSNWRLDKQGLTLNMPFALNEGHPIDFETQNVLIPWAELKDVLKIDPQKLFE